MTSLTAGHTKSIQKTKEKYLIFPMTRDRAGNANPFLETSVYTLWTSLVLEYLLLALFLGGLSVL